jgi:hypothetical protein
MRERIARIFRTHRRRTDAGNIRRQFRHMVTEVDDPFLE